ncbi:MAG: hypothetical protein KDA45_14000, partial [Planctomycetales bacterium]|nr:hypothetical protein [Planctomycetales bacterium]
MRKIQTLVMLLAAYLCATWLPGPGLWLRSVEFGSLTLPLPQVLLAGLLFTAGLCSTPDALRTILRLRRPFLLMALSAWLLPLLSAAVGAAVLWSLGCPPSVLLGMLVVAAMPVANSSVGWSTSMGGSVPLSIALLVVGTALSPLLSPMVINAGAVTMGTAEQALRETPWSEGM